MRIAVLSDIHDNVWKLDAALARLAACELMICCGDLCSPFIIDQLARGFAGPIQIVWGNNDADTWRMTAKAPKYPNIRIRGEFFQEEWGGRKIAVTHFDNIARAIAAAQAHDAVFFGHNHVFENRLAGKTLLLNPGSVLGAQFDAEARRTDVASTCAVYDTAAGTAERLDLT